jgi:predicted 2-oxoglutarate/Fe(II)-dependent dioxygenase YbiX
VAEAEVERPQPPRLLTGDYAPWFEAPALSGSPTYKFDTAAGRHMLLLFLGSAGFEASKAALDIVARHRSLFDDVDACFFGITVDPADAAEGRIAQALPGIRFFLDYDRKLSSLYGAVDGERYRPFWLVLTPDLRVAAHYPIDRGEQAIERLRGLIASIPDDRWAPVLTVPDILEPGLCRRLIELYESDGGKDSGFMREVGGKTVEVLDHSHKQRRDCPIADGELQRGLNARIRRRLNPALKRAFQFESTRIERHIVACYSAGEGHFRAHRDNTTKGTAHRKFAVTINLNSDYDGGDLRFPEFGGRTYRAPVGGAVVFSCSLLHEATPVTRGRRFAFLPFLYDEDGARIREANNAYLGEGLSPYRMEGPPSEG